MKKIFMSLMALAFMALTASLVSCDPNSAQCRKLSATYKSGAVQEEYFYGTGVEADARLEQIRQAAPSDNSVTRVHREQTFLSKDNCHK